MVRLKRLKVHRFRHVEPGTELHFGDTFNVLLGKNAVGKTTLLELINAVLNDDFTPFSGELRGFDLEYDLDLSDAATMKCRLARDVIDLGLADAIGSRGHYAGPRGTERGSVSWREPSADSWDCSIEQQTVTYQSGKKYKLSRDPSFGCRIDIFQEAHSSPAQYWFRETSKGVHASFLERAPRFDEADGFLSAIEAPTLFDFSAQGGSGNPFAWVAGGWPRSLLGKADTSLGGATALRLDSSQDSVLQAIATSLGFDTMEVSSSLAEKGDERTLYEAPHFLFQSGERKIARDRLSFGQRRFFAFLWYLAVRENLPVVADELVNGFHHEWISQCVEKLRSRQSFLATQNPLLLDDLPVTGADEPATTFIRCESKPGAKGELMTWRAFSAEEASRIAQAREVGIQSISETLRFEGLW